MNLGIRGFITIERVALKKPWAAAVMLIFKSGFTALVVKYKGEDEWRVF